MRRKLVKQGAATLMVSLPAKWLKENHLDKGNEVSIEEENHNLIISSQESEKKKQKETIDISGYKRLVNRVLIAEYIKGVDELEVKFKDKKEIEDFQKRVVHELLGFEIIKQTKDSILLKDITGAEHQDIETIVNRIFFILNSMAEELVISIKDKNNLDSVVEIDTSINRFSYFSLRLLNKKGYKNKNQTIQMYSIISKLEEIGDVYKAIAKEVKKSKTHGNLSEIIRLNKNMLSNFKESLFNYNKEKIVENSETYEQIKKKIKGTTGLESLLSQLNDITIRINNHLLVSSL